MHSTTAGKLHHDTEIQLGGIQLQVKVAACVRAVQVLLAVTGAQGDSGSSARAHTQLVIQKPKYGY